MIQKQSPPLVPSNQRTHLSYLDGVRGLAALYVVLVHVVGQLAAHPNGGGRIGRFLTQECPPFIWGTYAVCIFIVLSEYCLMLPVARSAGLELRGGFREYIRRRVRRILPPYYAALLLSLLVIGLTPLRNGGGTAWDTELPVTPHAIPTHLFLVHNLTRGDALKINGPLWSVATEWQIYFIFPLLLLPVWRRFGAGASALAGLTVGVAPHFVFHGRFDAALSEMVALFALGMAAAGVSFSAPAQERHWRETAPWGVLTVAGAALVVLLSLRGPSWVVAHFVLVNPIVGAAAACLLVYCTGQASKAAPAPLLRLLNSRGAVALGAFSYSLYLIHWPLLSLVQMPLVRYRVSSLGSLLTLLVAVPVIVGLAYLFHLVFERPFMGRPDDGTWGRGRSYRQPRAVDPTT